MPKSTTYHKSSYTFTVRVAAVIIENGPEGGRVLLHRQAQDEFWSLPGGKVELREEAEQALRREMREELHSEVEIERLVWLVENFFEHAGEKHHELGLYFLARLPRNDPHLNESVFEAAEQRADARPRPLFFRWFPAQPTPLAEMDIRPAFLREGLLQIPEEIQNIKIGSVNP